MAYTSDFQPFATGTGALVLTPATLATETWLYNGFSVGIADPASCNTVWRQSSFVAAGITSWMAQILQQNIHDDGNLTNFVNLFGSAITGGTQAGVTSFDGRTGAVTLTAADVTSALGYAPLQSFNGRSGQITLNAADVNNALGYTPVNKAGDTMAGALNGPSPTVSSQYATKGYVDSSISTNIHNYTSSNGITLSASNFTLSQIPNNTVLGNVSGATNYPYAITPNNLWQLVKSALPGSGITGSSSEYEFPLTNGGVIKVGYYNGSIVNGSQITIHFASNYTYFCAGAFVILSHVGVSLGQAAYSATITGAPSQSGFTFQAEGYQTGQEYSMPGAWWVAFGA